MDANEYTLKTQPAEKSLGLVLNTATSMGDAPAAQGTGYRGQGTVQEEIITLSETSPAVDAFVPTDP